jgi:hypothetical protein
LISKMHARRGEKEKEREREKKEREMGTLD